MALVNRSEAEALISADWNAIGLSPGLASVRNLWEQTDLGTFSDSFATIVPSHGVALVNMTGSDPPIPAGSSYLSDLTWSHQAQGWGMLRRDQSIEGRPMTLNGTTYPKGLGAHSPSTIEFRLNGACSIFESEIRVDDEVGSRGSVIFQVWADGAKLYESGLMTGGADRQSLSIDVSGMNEMRLVVNAGPDDINYDHADWANARVTCSAMSEWDRG